MSKGVKLMRSRVVLFSIATGFCLSVALFVSGKLIAQVSEKKVDTGPKAEVSRLVRQYWDLSQKGKFAAAGKLTTKSRKGFSYVSKEPSPTWEQVIYSTGLKFVEIEQVREVDVTEMEVASKVLNGSGREVYMFHTVVKNGKDWKIFVTTN